MWKMLVSIPCFSSLPGNFRKRRVRAALLVRASIDHEYMHWSTLSMRLFAEIAHGENRR